MTVYTCEANWEAMLTCIYEAWSSGKGHKNVRLMLEPLAQYELFQEYIHVDGDPKKAESVMDAVCRKISPHVFDELAYAGMGYEEDVLDTIYHMMILGFHLGPSVLDMVQYRDVMRFREIRTRVGNEAHSFREFIRFHEIGGAYIAHIEPQSRVLAAVAPHFADRMPSEYWIIVDDVHREAVIHPKDEPFYFRQLTEAEFEQILQTEQVNDEYTDLWKTFFRTIAIEERCNPKCQRNLFPIWIRKHAVEFGDGDFGI